ncbi:MAG: MmgE/PrpD family protein, partial [Nitrososphaerales archaeon]
DFEELVNALGVSACQATLGIIDAEGEEYSMVKNIASPISAQIALVATSLAKYGFTGSRRVLEGEKGFIKSILREEVDLNELLKGRNKPWILETRLKPYPVCGAALGIADAAVNLARKYQINPLEIESILVRTNKRSVKHVGDPVKRYPKNKETADHSAPFIIALAFLKGDVKFEYFKEELYSNPEVIKIIDKVKLEISPELDDPKIYPAAEVEVKTKDGSKYIHKTIYHKGHPKNRMSDKEIEEKFLSASLNKLGEDRAKEVIKAVYKLDRIKNISEFTELLRV